MLLQLLCLHKAYQLKVLLHLLPFGHNFKRAFGDPNLGVCGVRGELWGRELRQLKAHPRLPNAPQCKVLLSLPPFDAQLKCQVITPIRPPIWGVRVDIRVENRTNRNVLPTFLFDFCTHYWPILHHLASIHSAEDRQTDRGQEGQLTSHFSEWGSAIGFWPHFLLILL